MSIGSFWRQFQVLVWKNFLLKRRYWNVLLLELLIPTIIIFAISQIRLAIKPSVKGPSYPQTFTPATSLQDMYAGADCTGENLVWSCRHPYEDCFGYAPTTTGCQSRKIAVAPSDPNNVEAVSAAQGFASWVTASYAEAQSFSTFQLFPSESAFLDYVGGSQYVVDTSSSIISSAVIFSAGKPSWAYTLRMNRTVFYYGGLREMPSTSAPNLDISVAYDEDLPNGGRPFLEAYIYSGQLALGDVVNSYIATVTCRDSGLCPNDENVTINTMGGVKFPYPEVTINNFWGMIGFVFALLMIMTLLYPLANVIRALVQEKESKIRQGMLMMAMRTDVLWISWWLHFIALFLPLSIILTLVSTLLFVHSDPTFIFFYYFVFFLSSTSFCILVSTFFSKARTAAIVGCLVFFLGYFIFIGMQNAQPTRSQILLGCLHPSAAFTFGTLAFMEYEDARIGVTADTWNVSQTYEITFQDTLNMMFIDAIWMSVLSWYVANIWPSEFGTHKPWYFIFLPQFWWSAFSKLFICCELSSPAINYSRVKSIQDAAGVSEGSDRPAVDNEVPIEDVAENLAQQVDQNKCVDIRHLVKKFHTANGVKVAVDDFSLTMYSGQITALLGHNGAGKTTVISVLTGLLQADGGTALIEGRDIGSDMEEIRKNLGVCPQHDILFPDLTVEEHLTMFASFKGTPKPELAAEVEKMIQAVGLTEKRKSFAKTLSGGQKRKLSVGIAFIGGSRVVFLDEPTSGMDPYSRRFTWNLIRQHREGRIIVLTTHFMDEADMLGDRIAIMGDGKLRCCGSSLFLKRKYGVGYSMAIEKKDVNNFPFDQVNGLIMNFVKEAVLLTDVGTELTYQLPFSASAHFSAMFNELDRREDSLGIQSYGMSVTTLEEVFIKVASGTSTLATAEAGRRLRNNSSASQQGMERGRSNSNHTSEKGVEMVAMGPASIQAVLPAPADVEMGGVNNNKLADFRVIGPDQPFTLFARHIWAMLIKRYVYFIRDARSWIFQLIVPVLFLLAGLLIKTYAPFNTVQPSKTLTPHMYNGAIESFYLPTRFSASNEVCYPWGWCQYVSGQTHLLNGLPYAADLPVLATTDGNSIYNMSVALLDNRDQYAASQIGAFTIFSMKSLPSSSSAINNVSYVLHSNFTARHGAPLYQAIMAQAVVSNLNPSVTLTASMYLLPNTFRQNTVNAAETADIVATFFLLAIPYIPASFATYVVREREVKAKHQQIVSGVSVSAYWLGTWIWDVASYQLTVWLFVFIVAVFPDMELLVGTSNNAIGALIGLLQLFGGAIAGFSYLLSLIFSTPAMAQTVMIFVIFLLGLILGIVGTVLRFIPDTHDFFMSTIRYILAIFPPFALADGLHNLAYIDGWSVLELEGGKKYNVLDWEICGLGLAFLGAECVVYLLAIISYEYLAAIPSLANCWRVPELPTDANVRDSDVLLEEARVNSNQAADSAILIKNVKKMYPNGKYAVRGVSLGIPNGECFGLLGINGAGKSTLLSILSGEFPPSSGEAFLGGKNLFSDIHNCRREIGFCPQFDSLFELLTGREHLQLYARIKGIHKDDINRLVDAKIAEMGLTEYADRAAGGYSGGNKRKLSVAVAMIGEPTIVFLDEPSTGMDPVARRFMWEVISDIAVKREKCSVILTTHSMEECEALCTRIGIMVGGVLRCLGNSQHLKARYGHGYQIEIGMMLPKQEAIAETMGRLMTALQKPIPQTGEEISLSRQEVLLALGGVGLSEWCQHISSTGSGSEIDAGLVLNGSVSGRLVASWILLEQCYSRISQFLLGTFGNFILRERQTAKLRVEVSAFEEQQEPVTEVESVNGNVDGADAGPVANNNNNTTHIHHHNHRRRRLAEMFDAIESRKQELGIQEYSIVQTSLEQIFNQFAAQQEEEKGVAAGLTI